MDQEMCLILVRAKYVSHQPAVVAKCGDFDHFMFLLEYEPFLVYDVNL